MKKFFQEFKDFINKGNVLNLAVAVIIGAAFGKIVTSLVDDIITPITSLLLGKVDIADLKLIIIQATETTNEVAVRYGMFLKNILDFLVIAMSVFIIVKIYTKMVKNIQKQIELTSQQLKNRGIKKEEIDEKIEKTVDDEKEKKEEEKEDTETKELLKEIRDLLKVKKTPVKKPEIKKGKE